MRVEGIEVEFFADIGGAVGAQDVEGEGAQAGEVARFGTNPAVIFEEGNIADVVAAVFDAPMLADCSGNCGRGQADLRRIEGRLIGRIPEAGLGVFMPGDPGDAGGGDDPAIPVGSEAAGDVEGLDPAVLLSAMPVT